MKGELPQLQLPGRAQGPLRAIFWDLDGIIINTEPYKYIAYLQVLIRFQIPLAVIESSGFLAHYRAHCVGRSREENAREQLLFWERHGYTLNLSWEAYAEERRRYYEPIKPELPLIAKNVAFLRQAPGGCRMYLVSRTREEEAKRILRDHEESLSRLIVAIITRGPKYERAIMAATVEGIRKDECVAIEDISEGVKEAK